MRKSRMAVVMLDLRRIDLTNMMALSIQVLQQGIVISADGLHHDAYLVDLIVGCAEEGWRRLRGFRQFGEVIAGTKFVDGRRAADSSVDEMAA